MSWERKVFKNGKIQLRRRDTDGKLHGLPSLVEYDSFGLLRAVHCHEHGVLHSPPGVPTSTTWGTEGLISEQSYRRRGRYHGLHSLVINDHNGKLSKARSYRRGRFAVYNDIPSYIEYNDGVVVWQMWLANNTLHREDNMLPARLEWRPDGTDLFIGWQGPAVAAGRPVFIYQRGDGEENVQYKDDRGPMVTRKSRDHKLDKYKWEGEVVLHGIEALGELYDIDLYDIEAE